MPVCHSSALQCSAMAVPVAVARRSRSGAAIANAWRKKYPIDPRYSSTRVPGTRAPWYSSTVPGYRYRYIQDINSCPYCASTCQSKILAHMHDCVRTVLYCHGNPVSIELVSTTLASNIDNKCTTTTTTLSKIVSNLRRILLEYSSTKAASIRRYRIWVLS